MKFQRSIGAMLAATAFLAILSSSDVNASGRRFAGAPSEYYGFPYGHAYFYGNPYVAPVPAYGILPAPYAAYWQNYGYDLYSGKRRTQDEPEFGPRKRSSKLPEAPPSPQKRADDLRRARFEITVPKADAIVLFDGTKTSQTGLTRVFVTPPLTEDKLYSSTIEVQWIGEDGAKDSKRKTFEYVAGESMSHRFE